MAAGGFIFQYEGGAHLRLQTAPENTRTTRPGPTRPTRPTGADARLSWRPTEAAASYEKRLKMR